MIASAKNLDKSWNKVSDRLIESCNIDLTRFVYTDEFSSIDSLGHVHYLNDQIDEYLENLHHGDILESSASKERFKQETSLQNKISGVGHSELEFREQYRPESDLSENYESPVGRFISTNEPIREGKLVMEENAFAFVSVYSSNGMNQTFDHCQNCGEINCVPTLCPKCKYASYCSKKCQNDHEYIHQLECLGCQMGLWMNVGIAHLAFRTFITGFEQSKKIFATIKQNLSATQILDNLISHDTNFIYRDVLKLVTNFDKMIARDLFTYCLTARMLVLYLDKYTTFFSEMSMTCLNIMPEIGGWKRYAMALLLKHLGQMIMNAHTISGIRFIPQSDHISPRNFHLLTDVNLIFSAIFPKTSIFNHSCNENARNFFNGRTLRMFAQCDIPQNNELTNSYGPNYRLYPTDVRQSLLMERYHFKCDCEKCSTNDKTFESLSQQTCSNENCNSQIRLHNIEFQWWNYDVLEDLRLSSEMMALFRCKRCDEMQKLNPENLTKYFCQVRTAKNENNERMVRVNCLDESAYFYLESVTSLAIGHELRLAMGEAILEFDMFDLVGEHTYMKCALALVAVDFCKNTIQRSGFYSLEYMKSLTYAFHQLDLMTPRRDDAFQKMIEKSLEIKNIYKYIPILPDRMQAIYRLIVEKVCISKV